MPIALFGEKTVTVAAGHLQTLSKHCDVILDIRRVICNSSTAQVWPLQLVPAMERHGLVTEAVVEDKKEHLLRARGNEDDACFHAHTFSALVGAEQDKLLFRLF